MSGRLQIYFFILLNSSPPNVPKKSYQNSNSLKMCNETNKKINSYRGHKEWEEHLKPRPTQPYCHIFFNKNSWTK